jgi:hypothetical protein
MRSRLLEQKTNNVRTRIITKSTKSIKIINI